jgi:quercetin dioxygenase-like cupin family protein
MRLTLMAIRTGSAVQEHRTGHQVSIHTVSGHVVVHAQGQALDLPAGHVVVLERGIAHDVTATEDSAVLITVASP